MQHSQRIVLRYLDVVFPLIDVSLILNGLRVVLQIGWDFLILRENLHFIGSLYIFTAAVLLLLALASLVALRLHTHACIPSSPPKLPQDSTPQHFAHSPGTNDVKAWILNIAVQSKQAQGIGNEVVFNVCRKEKDEKWKPPRTHHCSTCGTCRVGFDHHCPWIGTCLTEDILPRFALFLFCIALVPIVSLAPLFILPAPPATDTSILSPDTHTGFNMNSPMDLVYWNSPKVFFTNAILPSRIYHAYVHSHASIVIRDLWWKRWYSWFLVMGPIGRVPVGILLGIRELETNDLDNQKQPGDQIARPGVLLVLTTAYGLLFSVFASVMFIMTFHNIRRGLTTFEATFAEGSVILPRRSSSTPCDNPCDNEDTAKPCVCVWVALSVNALETDLERSRDSKPSISDLVSTDGSHSSKPVEETHPKKRVMLPIYLSFDQIDEMILYSARHTTVTSLIFEGFRTSVSFFLPPRLRPDQSTVPSTLTQAKGAWGDWDWPLASANMTEIAYNRWIDNQPTLAE